MAEPLLALQELLDSASVDRRIWLETLESRVYSIVISSFTTTSKSALSI